MIWHNVIHAEMTEKCLGRTENTSQGTEIREDPSEQIEWVPNLYFSGNQFLIIN